jgi:hypothetical protein
MITIRYFYDGEKLVMNRSQLRAVLADKKADIQNVIHWTDVGGWTDVVKEAVELLRARLIMGIWGSGAAAAWALLVTFLIWWFPLGQRVFFDKAFPIVLALPLVMVFMALWGCLKCLSLLWRLPKMQRRILATDATLSCERILPPGSLLAKTEPPEIKRRGTVIALVVLFLIVTVFNLAIPIPGMKVMVHHQDGTTSISKKPCRLALGEWWEFVPRYVTGTTYGYIYYNDEVDKVLVFVVKYKLDNDKNFAANDVRQKIGVWAMNIGQHFASYAQGVMPLNMTKAEEMEFMREMFSEREVLETLKTALENAALEVLDLHFTELEVTVGVVSVIDYQNQMKKYYD